MSRLQLDSVTEQLNTMFHELLHKVTGQEQDWHKVVDKLSTEMEHKVDPGQGPPHRSVGRSRAVMMVCDDVCPALSPQLNRMELDSVKKQLEDRWKNIHEQLQTQGAPEHQDAAGIRKYESSWVSHQFSVLLDSSGTDTQ